ncbi:MAG: caspase family protein [Deinococcota bacterium]
MTHSNFAGRLSCDCHLYFRKCVEGGVVTTYLFILLAFVLLPATFAQVPLTAPAFLITSLNTSSTQDAFAFLEHEAGIAVYFQRDSLNLNRLKTNYRIIEAETAEYLLGSVPVPGYEAYESYDATVYARADGWLVIYYPNNYFTSFVIDWSAYAAGRNQSGTQIQVPTKLERVAAFFGARLGASEDDLRFYDFRFPEATTLLLMVDYGQTGRLEFSYTLPSGFNGLDVSFSHAPAGNCANSLLFNGGLASNLAVEDEHTDHLRPEGLETERLHQLTSYNLDPNCGTPAYVGIAITSQTPSQTPARSAYLLPTDAKRVSLEQLSYLSTRGTLPLLYAQSTTQLPSQRVRIRSAEHNRNISLIPPAFTKSSTEMLLEESPSVEEAESSEPPDATPADTPPDPQSIPTLQLISPLATSTLQGSELVIEVFVQVPPGHSVRYEAMANGIPLAPSRNLAARPARGDQVELRYILPPTLQSGTSVMIELVAVNTTTGAESTPLIFSLTYTATASPDRVALVIGNSIYQHALSLRNPVNDATAVASMLADTGFAVTLHTNLTLAELHNAVDEFQAQLPADATALIYYSGHGLQVGGHNYLVPVDANISDTADIATSGYALTNILAALADASTGLNLIILDACRDNPFAQVPSVADGLAAISAPAETYIAYATAPNTVASDGLGRHSPFTRSLLEVVPTPSLTLDAIFAEVGRRVETITNQRQIPWVAANLTQEVVLIEASSIP